MATNPALPFDYMARLDRQNRRRQQSSNDPVGDALRGIQTQEQVDALRQAPAPDRVARTTRLAREAQDTPFNVEGREDEVQTSLDAQRFGSLAERYPAIGRFAQANPRGAAMARDDHESLGLLGTAWDFLKNAPGRIVGGIVYGVTQDINSIYGAVEDLNQAVQSPIYAGLSALSQASGVRALDPTAMLEYDRQRRSRRESYFSGLSEGVKTEYRGANAISEGLLIGTDSVGQTLAAIATGNPSAAAGVLGGMVGAQAYGDARAKGWDAARALRYGVVQGSIEGVTEKIPASTLLEMITRKLPFGKAFVREFGQEMTGEQFATFFQDLSDYSQDPANRDKTIGDFWRERPQAALSTALAVAGGTSVTTGGIALTQRAADATVRFSKRRSEAEAARRDAEGLDRLDKALGASKLKGRDADALRQVLAEQAKDAGTQHVFIPADAVRTYQQSDGYDGSQDPWASLDWQDVELAGGDIVMPIEEALTQVVGTPAWDAVKADVRLTAGGMSLREADDFGAAFADIQDTLSQQAQAQDVADQAGKSVREKLVGELALKFGESYTADVARKYAELAVQRAATRASRRGSELTAGEFANLDVRQVLPEGVAQAVQSDTLDLVVNAMRQGKPTEVGQGESLLAWLKARGGINDTGGDLASMGLPKRLIRTSQRDMLQVGSGDYGVDSTLRAAISDGFFPELAGVEGQAGPSQLDTQVLLDAIGRELAGEKVFRETRADPMRQAGEELRGILSDAGLDPATASDADIRAAVAAFEAGATEGRGYEQEARGRIIFDEAKRTIELFQSRNLSTPIHELGHMWLEELQADAAMPDAPEQVKEDWATVAKWFADNGHEVGDGQIPTEAHELWARGTERYIMEGKAPSPLLTRLFETMRAWLVNIYRTVQRLNTPITPEIREVFDRLLATDEEIAAAREEQALTALFKDMPEGMGEAEYAAYRAQVEAAKAEASSRLLDKTMATIRRQTKDRYRGYRKAIRAEEEARIDGSPLFTALAAMKADRIDKTWLTDNFGADVTDLLPVRVPPLYREGGADPEAVAELAGYPSARDMIEALIGAEKAHRQDREGGDQRSMRERAIDTATDAEFNRRYGDPFNDGSIEREALAAIHNDRQGEVMASELRILSRSTGQRPTPYRAARTWARRRVREGVVAEQASLSAIAQHRRNSAKAGRAAEAAIMAGDAQEAFRQKQAQMLSSAMLAEAKEAYDAVSAAEKRLSKLAKVRTRKSVDQDYLEQAQALLENVELRKRSQLSINRAGKWEAWAQAREAEGYDVLTPPSFEAMLGKTNYTRLPVQDFLTLDEQVKQILHLGRLKQTLLDNADARKWDEIIGEAVDGAGNLRGKPPADLAEPGWRDAFAASALAADAALLKMETVFDWLDGGDSNGVFNRVAFRPIAEAQAREQDMLVDYYAKIKARFEAVPAEGTRRWNDRLVAPWMDVETDRPMVLNRKQAVAMALNIGNEGNLQRLADGYSVNAGAIQAWLGETLTAEEWGFVQGVWDDIDTLWPEIAALERKVNGIAPDKVEPRSFNTPHGTMRGGYYPAVYDSTRDYRAEENRGRESDLFAGNFTKATTRSSSTKERAEKVNRPILLDLGVINRHLGEVIHDITHREAVINANRMLSNERVRRAIDASLGREIGKQLRPWVKHVANSWALERAGNEGIGKWLGKLRANVTAVGMGLRATTMVTQIAGYSNSFEAVGEQWVAPQIARFAASPIELTRFVMERSGELRHRMDTLDRDIASQLAIVAASNPATKAWAVAQEARAFMFHGIGYMDRLVSIPTWLGAYNKALAAGMSESDAAYAGDKAVRVSQGAGAAKDLAAIQRGTGKWGEALKLMTMFYSFFSAQYQRQRTLGRDAMAKDTRKTRSSRLVARAFWLLVVPPLLVEVLRASVGADAGPDDDEWWAQWVMRKLLANSLGPIPVARDLFEPSWQAAIKGEAYNPAISPLQRVFDVTFKNAGNVGKIARGEETKRATKDALEFAGYTTGLIPGQVASAVQFAVDVGEGEADPQGFQDWTQGLLTGKLED